VWARPVFIWVSPVLQATKLLLALFRRALTCTEIYRTLFIEYTMSHAVPRVKQKKRSARSAKSYRFDARLNAEQKLLIQRAADLEGRTMTDFVLRSAESAAARTLQERARLILTARETETFVNAILNPPEPGPVLRKAARHYKAKMGMK